MGVVELERERGELLERAVVVGLLPRPAQPRLDRVAVALGEMVKHVALLVLTYSVGPARRCRTPAGSLSCSPFDPSMTNSSPCSTSSPRSTRSASSAAADGRVLGRAVPQPERELLALGRDPQRDDVRTAVQLDPVEHDHRQTQVGQRTVHQVPQQVAGSLHERPGHRRLRRRPGVGLDLVRRPVPARGGTGEWTRRRASAPARPRRAGRGPRSARTCSAAPLTRRPRSGPAAA